MIMEFRRLEQADIERMGQIHESMRELLMEWKAGRIPNNEYTKDDIRKYCESLIKNQAGEIENMNPGSWCLASTIEGMPGDARVEFVFLPTYIAVSTLTKFKKEYPEEAGRLEGLDDALRSGMEFAAARGLKGHGYEADDEMADAIEILGAGHVPQYLKSNPRVSPSLLDALKKAKSEAVERLRDGNTRGAWGEDLSRQWKTIAKELENL